MDSPHEEFYSYIMNIDKATINGIANEGINYPGLGPTVIDLMKRVKRVHITLSNEETYQEELSNNLISQLFGLNQNIISFPHVISFANLCKENITKAGISFFKRKISKMPIVNKENPHISSQLEHFSNDRLRLATKLKLYGNELDRNYLITIIVRLFGYTLGIIDLQNSDAYLDGIPIESSKLLSFLGHSVRCISVFAAYFGPICLLTTFAQFFRAKYILNDCIKLIEEDKRQLLPIETFVSETCAMQAVVTELFLKKIDEKIAKKAEETLIDLTSAQKIFATVLVSSMKKYPLCIRDGMFLHVSYQFSMTAEAKEWFRRLTYHVDLDQERKVEDSLMNFKILNCISNPPLQAFLYFFKPPILPRIVLFGLHITCMFYEIKEFNCVKECMLSKDLRNLAFNYEKCVKNVKDSQSVNGVL